MAIAARKFFCLVHQELYRFSRLINQTIFPPIISTVLFILIFGYSLGNRITEISGFSYIVYIIPGLASLGVINSAFSNTSTSLYMARFDRSIDNLLAAPLGAVALVMAFVIGGIVRGLLVGVLTLAVALPFLHPAVHHWGHTFYFLVSQSLVFSCIGIIGALRAKSWDNLATLQNFIITPLTYLAGVFYSIRLLPPFWQRVSLFNPLLYFVDGLRFGLLGTSDVSVETCLVLTFFTGGLLLALCVFLFQRGYRLVR